MPGIDSCLLIDMDMRFLEALPVLSVSPQRRRDCRAVPFYLAALAGVGNQDGNGAAVCVG